MTPKPPGQEQEIVTVTGSEIVPARRRETSPDRAFADFLKLKVADGDASPHTVRAYRQHVQAFADWCQTNSIQPGQATEADLELYRQHLKNAGYKRSTIASKLQAVRRFFDAAGWRGIRTDNPAKGVRAPKDRTSRVTQIRKKALPLEAIQNLLDAPTVHGPHITYADPDIPPETIRARDRVIIALMVLHGLRVTEVANLSLDDVNLDHQPYSLVVHGKGHKDRVVYLINRTVELLRAWLDLRRPVVAAYNPDMPALLLTFSRASLIQPLQTQDCRRVVNFYLKVTGWKAKGVSCHALRHTFATWAAYAGADIPAISAALGHADIATTGLYAQVADAMKQNPAEALAGLL
jgi:site-specific recombinase XerD